MDSRCTNTRVLVAAFSCSVVLMVSKAVRERRALVMGTA